jgi:hypothetical protein
MMSSFTAMSPCQPRERIPFLVMSKTGTVYGMMGMNPQNHIDDHCLFLAQRREL